MCIRTAGECKRLFRVLHLRSHLLLYTRSEVRRILSDEVFSLLSIDTTRPKSMRILHQSVCDCMQLRERGRNCLLGRAPSPDKAALRLPWSHKIASNSAVWWRITHSEPNHLTFHSNSHVTVPLSPSIQASNAGVSEATLSYEDHRDQLISLVEKNANKIHDHLDQEDGQKMESSIYSRLGTKHIRTNARSSEFPSQTRLVVIEEV